jgi:hypothetical protein
VKEKQEAWKPGLRPVEALLSVLCLDTWIEGAAKEDGLPGDRDRRHDFCSQASDSMWRMPGHTEAMKAVVSCDKPRGAAHTH